MIAKRLSFQCKTDVFRFQRNEGNKLIQPIFSGDLAQRFIFQFKVIRRRNFLVENQFQQLGRIWPFQRFSFKQLEDNESIKFEIL